MRNTNPDQRVQERALQTRRDLLDAARRVFARDGFVQARLQDIAESAGKTRGALYAHFKDKEDLFFALIEQDMEDDTSVLFKGDIEGASLEQRIQLVTQKLERVLHNRQRSLLYIEFKLYTIRHPHRQKRLTELHAAFTDRCISNEISPLSELSRLPAERRRHVFAMLSSVLDGLSLNFHFDPSALDEQQIHSRIEHAVREFLNAPSANPDSNVFGSGVAAQSLIAASTAAPDHL